MTIFNETDHLRVDNGQFTNKPQSAPDISLQATPEMTTDEVRDIALDPASAAGDLAQLAELDTWLYDVWICRHPNIDDDTLTTVYERGDTQVRTSTLARPNVPAHILHSAVTDRVREVRMMAAGHPDLTAEDQLVAAHDETPHVQNAVLNNQSLTTDALDALRQSQDLWVLERIDAFDSAKVAA